MTCTADHTFWGYQMVKNKIRRDVKGNGGERYIDGFGGET
jgi:hypothetical protein